jgi:hypothetical protein
MHDRLGGLGATAGLVRARCFGELGEHAPNVLGSSMMGVRCRLVAALRCPRRQNGHPQGRRRATSRSALT